MNRIRTLALLTFTVALAPCSAFAQEGTATKKEFQEWIEIMTGRFIGDVPLVNDWPGIGKKGEKITAYVEIKPVADGKALYGEWVAGEGKAVWLTTWNPRTKQIKQTTVFTSGIFWENVVTKDGPNKWRVRKTAASMPDGENIEGEIIITISDDGKTHTHEGTWRVGEDTLDKIRDVYTRLTDYRRDKRQNQAVNGSRRQRGF